MWLCVCSTAVLCAPGCRRDRSGICTYSVTRVPANIGFKDFSPGDLDTIRLHYLRLSNDTYTVTHSHISTAGASATVTLHAGGAIDVEIPARNRTYRLDSAHYSSAETFQFYTEDASTCAVGRVFTAAPSRIRVDGKWVTQETGGFWHYFLRP